MRNLGDTVTGAERSEWLTLCRWGFLGLILAMAFLEATVLIGQLVSGFLGTGDAWQLFAAWLAPTGCMAAVLVALMIDFVRIRRRVIHSAPWNGKARAARARGTTPGTEKIDDR
jgi:hypothetical protein